MMITGKLTFGVKHGDKRHHDFEMRMPTIGDNIEALNAFPDGSSVQIELAMYASAMTKLGDIPEEDITYELLASQMQPHDYDYIGQLVEAAKKKLLQEIES